MQQLFLDFFRKGDGFDPQILRSRVSSASKRAALRPASTAFNRRAVSSRFDWAAAMSSWRRFSRASITPRSGLKKTRFRTTTRIQTRTKVTMTLASISSMKGRSVRLSEIRVYHIDSLKIQFRAGTEAQRERRIFLTSPTKKRLPATKTVPPGPARRRAWARAFPRSGSRTVFEANAGALARISSGEAARL